MIANVVVTWNVESAGEFSAAMRAHGLRKIAQDCEVSPQTACNWASGTPIPDWAMGRICAAIGWHRPMLRYRQLPPPGSASPGVAVAEMDFTGGIIRKKAGRPRKAPTVAAPVAEPVAG